METKIKSRKFVVWLTCVALFIGTVFITKAVTAELINMFTVVSALYIGGNTATKYLNKETAVNGK